MALANSAKDFIGDVASPRKAKSLANDKFAGKKVERKPAPSATPGTSGEVATLSAKDIKIDRKTLASKNAKKDEGEQDLATEKPDGDDDAAAKESGALEEDGAETDDEAEQKRHQAGNARAAGWVASQQEQ